VHIQQRPFNSTVFIALATIQCSSTDDPPFDRTVMTDKRRLLNARVVASANELPSKDGDTAHTCVSRLSPTGQTSINDRAEVMNIHTVTLHHS
jgi:hypothetical protein